MNTDANKLELIQHFFVVIRFIRFAFLIFRRYTSIYTLKLLKLHSLHAVKLQLHSLFSSLLSWDEILSFYFQKVSDWFVFHNIKNLIFLSRKNCSSIICATDTNLLCNGSDICSSLISTFQRVLSLKFFHLIHVSYSGNIPS